MDEETRKHFSAYVADLRETADKDYIAARVTNRLGLYQVSAWSGLQAIEKYLKAILLYSDRCVKKHRSHNLAELLQEVERLPHIGFGLPSDCREFLDYLDQQGSNRYLDVPLYVEGLELFELDRLVWHIRRYCQDFLLLPGDATRYPGESQKRLATIPDDASAATLTTFEIKRGYLEKLVAGKPSELRSYLIWKNRFYGLRMKRSVTYTPRISWRKPIHVMRPEIILAELEQRVYFPKPVLLELKKLKTRRKNQGAS